MILGYKNFLESIRSEYQNSSPAIFYSSKKDQYSNPHTPQVEKSLDYLISKIDIGYFLDLGCGDGIVSNFLKSKGISKFKGCDPYFSEIYQKKTGSECIEMSFEDISKTGLDEKFDTIICSYSLHLCDKTYYSNLLYQLSQSCINMIVISPSKYPLVSEDYFSLVDNKIIDRTHNRIFKSKLNNEN